MLRAPSFLTTIYHLAVHIVLRHCFQKKYSFFHLLLLFPLSGCLMQISLQHRSFSQSLTLLCQMLWLIYITEQFDANLPVCEKLCESSVFPFGSHYKMQFLHCRKKKKADQHISASKIKLRRRMRWGCLQVIKV